MVEIYVEQFFASIVKFVKCHLDFLHEGKFFFFLIKSGILHQMSDNGHFLEHNSFNCKIAQPCSRRPLTVLDLRRATQPCSRTHSGSNYPSVLP